MLVHLRLTVPEDLTGPVREHLLGHRCVTNLTWSAGASLVPAGDLVECDVAREQASDLLTQLDDLGVSDTGGILVTLPDATPFRAATEMERTTPGDPQDAILWEEVLERAESASHPTLTHHVFLVLAVVLAAVAVITDSAVTVVGAMVVGPEFSAVAAIAIGVAFGRWRTALASAKLVLLSFAFAILAVAVLAAGVHALGLLEDEVLTRPRPQTGFIWQPDTWSFVVALVAGAAGVLALTTHRTEAMVGVFISVTTVPAAGNLALALGLWNTSEMGGSLAQLAINLGGMVLAGLFVLVVQRLCWQRLLRISEKVFRGPGARSQRWVGTRR